MSAAGRHDALARHAYNAAARHYHRYGRQHKRSLTPAPLRRYPPSATRRGMLASTCAGTQGDVERRHVLSLTDFEYSSDTMKTAAFLLPPRG